jgi:hypothetical protein
MSHLQSKRPAVAMIELIFALVIMGIVMMSAPTLIATASKSGFATTQQEAISIAASQVNMIMGYSWDENDANNSYIAPLLHVSSGDSDLDEYGTTSRRIGTPKESPHSFLRSDGLEFNATASSNFGAGKDTGETSTADNDDIDDFSANTTTLILIETSAADVTDRTLTMDSNISYMSDTASYNTNSITFNADTTTVADTSNIKHIKVTLTSDSGVKELSKKIILHAFSCNIGAYTLEEREVN